MNITNTREHYHTSAFRSSAGSIIVVLCGFPRCTDCVAVLCCLIFPKPNNKLVQRFIIFFSLECFYVCHVLLVNCTTRQNARQQFHATARTTYRNEETTMPPLGTIFTVEEFRLPTSCYTVKGNKYTTILIQQLVCNNRGWRAVLLGDSDSCYRYRGFTGNETRE